MVENKYPRSVFTILAISNPLIFLFVDRSSDLYIHLNWLLGIIVVTAFVVILILRTRKFGKFDYYSAIGIIATITLMIASLNLAK